MEQRALRTPSPLLGIAVVQCAVGRGHGCGQCTRGDGCVGLYFFSIIDYPQSHEVRTNTTGLYFFYYPETTPRLSLLLVPLPLSTRTPCGRARRSARAIGGGGALLPEMLGTPQTLATPAEPSWRNESRVPTNDVKKIYRGWLPAVNVMRCEYEKLKSCPCFLESP